MRVERTDPRHHEIYRAERPGLRPAVCIDDHGRDAFAPERQRRRRAMLAVDDHEAISRTRDDERREVAPVEVGDDAPHIARAFGGDAALVARVDAARRKRNPGELWRVSEIGIAPPMIEQRG